MKRMLPIVLILIASALQSCDNNKTSHCVDYGCETSYEVDNQTGKVITFIRLYGYFDNGNEFEELTRTVSVAPGEKKEIYEDWELCGENTMIHEFGGEWLPIHSYPIDIYADGRQVNEDILSRENWTFSAEKYYHATYLMILTDDLIESAGYM